LRCGFAVGFILGPSLFYLLLLNLLCLPGHLSCRLRCLAIIFNLELLVLRFIGNAFHPQRLRQVLIESRWFGIGADEDARVIKFLGNAGW
jgi:hypothetical protein